MNINLFFILTVALSAGTGSLITEVIVKMMLGDWINRRFYKYKLRTSDKRECTLELLELLNYKHNREWLTLSSPIYYKVQHLIHRLSFIKEKKLSSLLQLYAGKQSVRSTYYKAALSDANDPEMRKKLFKIYNQNEKKVVDLHNQLLDSLSL